MLTYLSMIKQLGLKPSQRISMFCYHFSSAGYDALLHSHAGEYGHFASINFKEHILPIEKETHDRTELV